MNNMECCSTPNITDWLIVIITFIYMVATIAIFIANLISAQSSKKQINETKQQFIENKRIDNMPLINITITETILPAYCMELDITEDAEGDLLSKTKQVVFENIGKGIAKNITCTYYSNVIGKKKIMEIPILPIKENESINIIFCAKSGALINSDSTTALFEIEFEDLFDNKYLQKIEVEYLIQEDEHMDMYIEKIKVYAPNVVA